MDKKPRDNLQDNIDNMPVNTWLIGEQETEYTFDEFEVLSKVGNKTYLVLIIFDVVNDKKRYRISKTLKGYGEWVQRSAFECHLTNRQYQKMIEDILPYFDFDEDLLRIYKLTGQTEVKVYGKIKPTEDEDLIII